VQNDSHSALLAMGIEPQNTAAMGVAQFGEPGQVDFPEAIRQPARYNRPGV
jgi:hypothetical protein